MRGASQQQQQQQAQGTPIGARLPLMRGARPILAIDTAPSHANGSASANGNGSVNGNGNANGNGNGGGHLPVPHSSINGEPLSGQVLSAAALQDLSPKTSTSSREW